MIYKKVNTNGVTFTIEVLINQGATEGEFSVKVNGYGDDGSVFHRQLDTSTVGTLVPFYIDNRIIFSVVLLQGKIDMSTVDASHTLFIYQDGAVLPEKSDLTELHTVATCDSPVLNDILVRVIPDTIVDTQDSAVKLGADGGISLPEGAQLVSLVHLKPHSCGAKYLYMVGEVGTDLLQYATLNEGDLLHVGYIIDEQPVLSYCRYSTAVNEPPQFSKED